MYHIFSCIFQDFFLEPKAVFLRAKADLPKCSDTQFSNRRTLTLSKALRIKSLLNLTVNKGRIKTHRLTSFKGLRCENNLYLPNMDSKTSDVANHTVFSAIPSLSFLRIQDFLICAFPSKVLELHNNSSLVEIYQKQSSCFF